MLSPPIYLRHYTTAYQGFVSSLDENIQGYCGGAKHQRRHQARVGCKMRPNAAPMTFKKMIEPPAVIRYDAQFVLSECYLSTFYARSEHAHNFCGYSVKMTVVTRVTTRILLTQSNNLDAQLSQQLFVHVEVSHDLSYSAACSCTIIFPFHNPPSHNLARSIEGFRYCFFLARCAAFHRHECVLF